MTAARQVHDWKDTLTVLQYLQEQNPFSLDPSLRSISTGMHAYPTVNVDEAVAVEDMILTEMNGTTPAVNTFQKKNQVVTLGLKSSSVKIDGDRIPIDPLLLFQRLTTVMQSSYDLELAFKHEFCSYLPALFDSSLLLHEADMPALADTVWKICKVVSQQISQMMGFSMSWMMEHFYNASHGLVVLHMETSAASTQNM